MKINETLTAADLAAKVKRVFEAAGPKIQDLAVNYPREMGTPVFTEAGRYTARGWTEWTQGFQYGMAILQYDATGDESFLEIGRENTRKYMASHVTHMGVHDHGFNNVSTYGNLWRLMNEGRIPEDAGSRDFYEMALKCTGAVQARRWSPTAEGGGYIYSFNGPHSLFCDTMRTLRALSVSHKLGHALCEEQDEVVSLLGRMIQHAEANAKYAIWYGEGRDSYDVRGRTAHESVFNVNNGVYRCPNSQQGYSPFTTWTRGQAWCVVGYPEQLEYLATVADSELEPYGGRAAVETMMLKAARAVCDYWIEDSPLDGIPYWDTGAPNLHKLGDFRSVVADPYNDHEPVDSSAAAIAAQGFLRLGRYLQGRGDAAGGARYWQAGLTLLDALFQEPYLSVDPAHQGLILHSVYHRPNGWDYVPAGRQVPCGESSMWGDYHALEVALYLQRVIDGKPYYAFFGE